MIRLELFRSRAFTVANLYTFLLYAALGGSLFFLPFDLINVQKYSPAQAGAALLPFIAIMFVFSRLSGGLTARIGARVPLVSGAILAAGGFAIFSFVGIGHSYWTTFFPGAVVLGFGGACFVAPLTTTVMDAVDVSHAGIASGINNAVSRTAGLLAIAALGIVLAGAFETTLARELAQARISANARTILQRDHAQIVAGSVPPELVEPRERKLVASAIEVAYARGFQLVMWYSALLALLAAALALEPAFRAVRSSR
jgi:MFS family permease